MKSYGKQLRQILISEFGVSHGSISAISQDTIRIRLECDSTKRLPDLYLDIFASEYDFEIIFFGNKRFFKVEGQQQNIEDIVWIVRPLIRDIQAKRLQLLKRGILPTRRNLDVKGGIIDSYLRYETLTDFIRRKLYPKKPNVLGFLEIPK